jgi:hypothetical protein
MGLQGFDDRQKVRKLDLGSESSVKEDLAFWLSRSPKDRIEATALLSRKFHGSAARLQRFARVIQQTQG